MNRSHIYKASMLNEEVKSIDIIIDCFKRNIPIGIVAGKEVILEVNGETKNKLIEGLEKDKEIKIKEIEEL